MPPTFPESLEFGENCGADGQGDPPGPAVGKPNATRFWAAEVNNGNAGNERADALRGAGRTRGEGQAERRRGATLAATVNPRPLSPRVRRLPTIAADSLLPRSAPCVRVERIELRVCQEEGHRREAAPIVAARRGARHGSARYREQELRRRDGQSAASNAAAHGLEPD